MIAYISYKEGQMKRTTIFADEETIVSLRQIAQKEGISTAEAVRQALNRFIMGHKDRRKLPSILGMGRSRRGDIAERCEELLWTDPKKKGRA